MVGTETRELILITRQNHKIYGAKSASPNPLQTLMNVTVFRYNQYIQVSWIIFFHHLVSFLTPVICGTLQLVFRHFCREILIVTSEKLWS